jgi:hypothetical protein
MFRIVTLASLLSITICSCNMSVKNEDKTPPDEMAKAKTVRVVEPIKAPGNTNFVVANEADIIGFWVGMFEPDTDDVQGVSAGEYYWDYSNKINICIDKIDGGKVQGHSIVAGNDRPFTGNVTFENDVYHFDLKEPGDNKYDGAFHFTIKQNDTLLDGKWNADKPLKISHRKYSLQKKLFNYDPTIKVDEYSRYVDWNKMKKGTYDEKNKDTYYDAEYFTTTNAIEKYNASTQKLTTKQVANLKKGDLFILRNTIYARHGYSFKNPQLRAYFDGQNWYIPASTDVKDLLTETEKQNVSLLLRYEKNAKEYYDAFGRG